MSWKRFPESMENASKNKQINIYVYSTHETFSGLTFSAALKEIPKIYLVQMWYKCIKLVVK